MAQQISHFTQAAPAKSIECVYVWLTKEKETDSFCCYSFAAEVYRRNTSSKHLVAVRSENGTLEIEKTKDANHTHCTSEESRSAICAQILHELEDSLQQRNYPNSRFLAFCNTLSETND
jgi:hypothetical protein